MRRVLACLFALSFVAAGCLGPPKAAEVDKESDAPTVAEQDTQTAAEISRVGKEARGWLARDDTMLFEISKDNGRQLVEEFYAAGITGMWIVDADKLSPEHQVEVGATFVAELPADPEARKRIFEVEKKWMEDPDGDQGQKYLMLPTD